MARWVRWNNPTIKPPIGAQIDWSNPITKGLLKCWAYHKGQLLDLKDQTPVFQRNTSKNGVDYLYFSGYDNPILYDDTPPKLPPFSVISEVKLWDNGLASSIFGCEYDGTGGWSLNFETYNDTGKLGFTKRFVVDLPSTISYPIGNRSLIGCTVYKDNSLKIFCNKKISYINDIQTFKTNTIAKYNIGGYFRSDTGNYVNLIKGYVYYLIIWNREFNDNEILNVQTEPYSFFLYPQYWYLVDFGQLISKLNIKWDIQNKKEKTIKYDILTKTNKNIKWNVLNSATKNIQWNILNTKNTTILWDILNKNDINLKYNILNSNDLNLKWNILNALNTSLKWNILNKKEVNLIWDILTGGVAYLTIKWNILNKESLNVKWNVLNSTTKNIKWDILNRIENQIVYDILNKADANIKYDILTKIEKQIKWNILNKLNLVLKYNILTRKEFELLWNILNATKLNIKWDINSNIIIKPAQVFSLEKTNTIFSIEGSNIIFKI